MYKVQRCIYQDKETERIGWLIISNELPYPFRVNCFLNSLKSPQTAKQYAYKICKYLNYIHSYFKIRYDQIDSHHLSLFIRSIQYNGKSILNYESTEKSEYTIRGYVETLNKLYCYLKSDGVHLNLEISVSKVKRRNSFFYGQNYYTPQYHIEYEHKTVSPKKRKEYIKWYKDEQIDAILSNFNSNRDKAIFLFSLSGMRIDEALSAQINLYDENNGTIKLSRSKGRYNPSDMRTCVLLKEAIKYLEDYLRTERSVVEEHFIELGLSLPEDIFINLKKHSSSFGKPVMYHNFYEILKRAATRAGLDPELIRTHSGRSTAVGRLFRAKAKNPSEISETMIREIMGWKSISAAEPYKNRQDPVVAKENRRILENAIGRLDK